MDITAQIQTAADYIRSRISIQPKVGMILGSGLGDYADTLTDAVLNGKSLADANRFLYGKEPLLISACLLGAACRYDGKRQPLDGLAQLQARYHLIPVCAEQLGGLSTPRIPAERCGSRVVNREGTDVTARFEAGAAEVLRLAQQYGCTKALLKERSPSCGHGEIYDGTFSGTKIPGSGVTAQLLHDNGIQIYGESQWEAL